MEKVAIISDIHGNLEALNSVLSDIEKRNIKRIFCLGDIIAKGTHSEECVNIVRSRCEVVVKGNVDSDYTRENVDLSLESEIFANRFLWNRNKLSEESITYLRSLPYCYEFYFSGRLVRIMHATPQKINGIVSSVDSLYKFYSLFLPSEHTLSDKKADVVIYGHIHIPYFQRLYNRAILNSGSVGNSIDVFRSKEKDGNVKNTTVANYLIISGNFGSMNMDEEISYEFVSVPYDIEKELAANTDNVERESYEEELRCGKYRDMSSVYKNFKERGIDVDKI